ncbi:MAG TPA: SCE4755 family polysaccharide monooxygenase-like protein, partial [Kofleriaceae bacterium]|nr:SCE4755 family polysaccharide monooxygenase-like protein [Kofleriaceae bacterium]
MRRLAIGLSAGLLASSAPAALAHVQLRAPLQRETAQKDGPCGAPASVRGATTCTFRPGSTITISFDETVDHDGHFRVAFDDDGQDFINPTTPEDIDPTVLINDHPDRVTTATDQNYTLDITFPDVECDNCTLQVIQVMSTAATYDEGDLYYQCADIVLSAAAPETPDPACVAPPPDDGGDGGDG